MALNDPDRLAAVVSSGLLDGEEQPVLDHLADLVRVVVGSPVAIVTALLEDRQVFAGLAGMEGPWADRRGTPLSHSFCQHVVTDGSPLVVHDSVNDPRVSDNEAVRDLGVAAYLGVPLHDEDGHVLGAVCAIDGEPRRWSDEDTAALTRLVPVVRDRVAQHRRTVTARAEARAAEAEAARSRQELLATTREADAGRDLAEAFVALASHDLRNPLGSILGAVHTLRVDGLEATQRAMTLDVLERSTRRTIALVDRLETDARSGARGLELTVVDLATTVDGVLDDLAATLAENDVTATRSPVLPSVTGDSVLLAQVVANLVSNAVQHGGPGTTLVVDAVRRDQDVLLTVTDDGPGVDPDIDPAIFSHGMRSVDSDGLGLGLATCRRVVERHGGTIWLEPAQPHGTRACVVLPDDHSG